MLDRSLSLHSRKGWAKLSQCCSGAMLDIPCLCGLSLLLPLHFQSLLSKRHERTKHENHIVSRDGPKSRTRHSETLVAVDSGPWAKGELEMALDKTCHCHSLSKLKWSWERIPAFRLFRRFCLSPRIWALACLDDLMVWWTEQGTRNGELLISSPSFARYIRCDLKEVTYPLYAIFSHL